MREIKFLGTFRKEGVSRSHQYSLFECEVCGEIVEKIRKDGFKAKSCSGKCYYENRTGQKFGPYTEKILRNGYYYIYKPDHPNATSPKGLYVAEHRLVMERKLDRYLKSDEIVHHINENKLDNSPGNLEVMDASEHGRLHATKRWRDKMVNSRFKFRVWCKKTEEMHTVGKMGFNEDGLWYVEDENHETQPPYFEDDDDDWALMQYTGLKDKKGKEIYENDVVRGQLLDLEVTYSDNGEWLTGHVPLSKRYMNVEVVGNKFEGVLKS